MVHSLAFGLLEQRVMQVFCCPVHQEAIRKNQQGERRRTRSKRKPTSHARSHFARVNGKVLVLAHDGADGKERRGDNDVAQHLGRGCEYRVGGAKSTRVDAKIKAGGATAAKAVLSFE